MIICTQKGADCAKAKDNVFLIIIKKKYIFNNIKAFNGFALCRKACFVSVANMDPMAEQTFEKNTDMTSLWI